MQVILSKDIYGYDGTVRRAHASKGDTLKVIFRDKTHFICDSLNYPNETVAIFHTQCKEILFDKEEEDEQAPEKYYNTYVEPEQVIGDDISNTDESQYGLLR
jgi:hypothetical protein